MFCMNCGQVLPDGVKFCSSCGKPVDLPDKDADLFINENSFREWSSGIGNPVRPSAENSQNANISTDKNVIKVQCKTCGGTELKKCGKIYICDHCGSIYFLDVQGRERKSASTATKVNELIEASKQLHESSQYAKELNVLAEALNLDDTNVDIVNKLGRCNRCLNRYDLAIEYYNKAISIDPNYGYAYNNIGLIYLLKEDYKAAKKLYEKGLPLIESDYDYWSAQAHYAVAIAKLGDPERAEKLISEAESRGYKYGDDKRKMAGLPNRT